MDSQVKTHANNSQSFLITTPEVLEGSEVVNHLQEVGIKIEKSSPDNIFIRAEKNSISIDAIRNLKKHIYQKPVKSAYRTAVIEEAHKLTKEAQNAFLKLLEEPPGTAKLILVSEKPKQLLPTVLSRLTKIGRPNPKKTSRTVAGPALNFQKSLTLSLESEDYKTYIDNEILANYQALINSLDDKASIKLYEKKLEKAYLTKKMVESNVNAKFAILNYLISSKI